MFVDLNTKNVLFFAIKSYESLNYIKSEFQEDYRLFRYVKRLLQRYRATGDIKINLVLNHINMIYNIFGVESATRILFLKIDKNDHSALKTILLFLHKMPDIVYGINGSNIISSDIPVDMTIAKMLREI
jgi:hypothetical protein